MKADNALIFKLLAYPKERGSPPLPREDSKVKVLASFEPQEFLRANEYMGNLVSSTTATRQRKVYLDSAGRLYHIEFPK
jgi:hypothetical protein